MVWGLEFENESFDCIETCAVLSRNGLLHKWRSTVYPALPGLTQDSSFRVEGFKALWSGV